MTHSVIQICATLAFLGVTVAIRQEKCEKRRCPGPLAYYEAVGCVPIYEDDCCATRYNCDHLKEKSPTKCYANGKEYEIGETVKNEEVSPCEVDCLCIITYNRTAMLVCSLVNCLDNVANLGCYRRYSPLKCCPGEEVCPKNSTDRTICNVNGKEYKDGESFTVENDPGLRCVCQPGYGGRNVEPFCVKSKHPYCNRHFSDTRDLFDNCAPVYYSNQSLQTSCSIFSRCQNNNDIVIRKSSNNNLSYVCHFGNMTMYRGDELNQNTDSGCIKCICEVPPVLTCQSLSNKTCTTNRYY